ncbi:Rho GTPase activation protein, partial [Blyttiomyces helicus]
PHRSPKPPPNRSGPASTDPYPGDADVGSEPGAAEEHAEDTRSIGIPASAEAGHGETRGEVEDDDDRLLAMLCDFENGFHLLLDRIKQTMQSTKDAVAFLKKRALIEEEYGKSMIKLAQSVANQKSDAKEGTYGEAWTQFARVHEQIGDIRLRFAESISEVSEELSALQNNTERSRKQLKVAGYRHYKTVQEAEVALEKAKTKYEQTSEEWERAVLNRELNDCDPLSSAGGGAGALTGGHGGGGGMTKSMSTPMMLWKQGTTNPVKLQKIEDESRVKASIANENYKSQLQLTNAVRNQYFNQHLPQFVRSLKETSEEGDQGLQYHLLRYAQELESSLMKEGTTLSPLEKDKLGIVKIVEKVENERDFKDYMRAYFQNRKHVQKSDHQYSPYAMCAEAISIVHPKPVFGVDLVTLMERDGTPVPTVVSKCVECVERHGMRTAGVYRVSGTNTLVQKLRTVLDRDAEHVSMDEWVSDIHNVTGVLKLYFRELPDPLFPRAMYKRFIEAARIEDERMRLIAIHEVVNQLHDANYATLQELMGHLWRIQSHESDTRMTVQNLSIVWGPTLLDSPDTASDPIELKLQSRVVETVLGNFEHIFETENE